MPLNKEMIFGLLGGDNMSLSYAGTWETSGTAPYSAILVIKSNGDVYVTVDDEQRVCQQGYHSEYPQTATIPIVAGSTYSISGGSRRTIYAYKV